MTSSGKFDKVDISIVEELQEDGRRPIREIARNLDLPEATVRLRLKRLQDVGGLQIVAYANPAQFGILKCALVLAKVRPSLRETLIETLMKWSEVLYLSTLLGSADLSVQLSARDDDELLQLTSRLRELDGVEEIHIYPEVSVHKVYWRVAQSN